MAEPISQHTEIDANARQEAQQPGILAPDVEMVVLTWITFFLLLGILYKFAWKPILEALDVREENIRKSLDDARKAREELARVTETSRRLVAEADEQAKEIVERSHKAAQETAKAVERKAKDEVQILMTNATQEIERQKEKVKVALQQESADLAVSLAGKILSEELHRDRHHRLIDHFIKDFHPEKRHENS